MSRAQLLYQLQSLDSEMDKTRQQLAEIMAKLGESDALKKARAAVEAAEKQARQVQTTMQDLNLEVKSLTDKVTSQEKALYGGKTLSAKEAANLQNEITSLKRWHSKREELLLETMLEAEEVEARLNQTRQALATVEAAWAADQETLSQAQRALRDQGAKLKERQPIIVEAIDQDDLDDYEDLRAAKAGRAVAMVKDGICQGCGVAASNSRIQQARTGPELTYCGTCGRILYVV